MSLPKFLEDSVKGKDARNKKPKLHERKTAEVLGGRVQPGSGSKDGFKGDVRDVATPIGEFLIECKRTEGRTLALKAQWLNKITTEAGFDKEPALAIQFNDDVLQKLTMPNQMTAESDWIAIPRSVFQRLLEEESK